MVAQDLNEHFSSVFTRENTNAIPLTENRFKGKYSEHLGKLTVESSIAVEQIDTMKANKPPGDDGIPTNILIETAIQLNILLRIMFSLLPKAGIVSGEWKEGNITPLFKKGSENYKPISLTCKLSERLIKNTSMCLVGNQF